MTSGPTWLVVLNWHGRQDTLELLASLAAEPATVLVVDNGSHDGTLEIVREQHSGVLTLQTGANLGYAGGNNAGIDYALAHGASVIGVLNNDTLVEPGFLRPLLTEIANDPHVALSPDIRYESDPDVSWFRGSFIDERGGWPQHLPPERQPSAEGGPFASPVLTGCCIVASAEVWREVGGFDDGMFLIFEDSDWSRRAVARAVRLLVVPESRILHKVSRSFTGISGPLGTYYFARNGTLFAWRHLGFLATLRFLWHAVIRPDARLLVVSGPHRPRKLIALLGVLHAAIGRRGPARGASLNLAERARALVS